MSTNTLDRVESRHADQTSVQSRMGMCLCQQGDHFIPAWTLEETESIPLNLGKCWKPKNTHKPRMRMRGGNLEKVHIKMHNETCYLREFIAAPAISTDPYSSDTQTPNDQDECTNPIEDADTRQELHWYKYLEGLRSTVCGDYTAT